MNSSLQLLNKKHGNKIIYSGINIIIGIALGVAGTLAVVEYNNRLFDRATGIFSSLHYVDEICDLFGSEVHIIYGGRSGYWVLFQESPGFPYPPVLVNADITDDHFITFKLPDYNGRVITYTGKITKDNLRLNYKYGESNQEEILPRTSSYWQ